MHFTIFFFTIWLLPSHFIFDPNLWTKNLLPSALYQVAQFSHPPQTQPASGAIALLCHHLLWVLLDLSSSLSFKKNCLKCCYMTLLDSHVKMYSSEMCIWLNKQNISTKHQAWLHLFTCFQVMGSCLDPCLPNISIFPSCADNPVSLTVQADILFFEGNFP